MPLYGKITRDLTDTGERKSMSVAPPPPDQIAPNKPYWVPVEEVVDDQSSGSVETVFEPWVVTVEAARILKTRVIRDKTAQELAEQDDKVVEGQFRVGSAERALAQALFQVVNEVRGLKGQGDLTVPQFKNYLKSLIRQ